jgi:ATP-dependent DNA helicase RecG
MNEKELRQIIASKKEDESTEFKTAANDFSVLGGKNQDKKCLYGYCVAIGNEKGGRVIFGVTNERKIVGTQALKDIEKVRAQMYDRMGVKIEIQEFLLPERVVVVDIPKRRAGRLFEFYGRYLTRAGEELVEMKQDEIAAILGETQDDFSAKYLNVGMDVLDVKAIQKMRKMYEKKAKVAVNGSKATLSDVQFLSDLGLLKNNKINNAALLLLGTEESLRDLLPDAEIIFEYRVNPEDTRYSDRVNFRKALVFSLDVLWDKINSRNFIHQLRERLIRRDVQAFNEDVVREAINNAIVHRDYQARKSVFIRQDNTKIIFENPGGFMAGITPENVYKQVAYRNRRLAESFEKIGLVERSGQGADLIFENNIREGKGIPQYETTQYDTALTLSAVIKDEEIILYLDEVTRNKQMSLTVDDLVMLEKIKERSTKGIIKKEVQKFLDAGIVVTDGAGRGTKYFLSKQYYKDHNRLGEYTKIKGLGRAGIKELILGHLKEHKKVTSQECQQISPNLTPKDVTNILQELRSDGKIQFVGGKRKGNWVLIGKN